MIFLIPSLLFVFILPAFVKAAGTPEPTPATTELHCKSYGTVTPIEEQRQEWVDWCTFASVRVATSHYNLPQSQCQLVTATAGIDCCLDVNENNIDGPCHPNPSKWPSEVFDTSTVNFTYDPLPYQTVPEWGTILREICGNNRPIVAVTSLASLAPPNWHTVVVEGYFLHLTPQGNVKKVRVFDPQEDLCDGTTCEENPRFLTYDYFFLSGMDHHTDYKEIGPK